ncbi:NCS2 family permease [Bacilliculturomica massiliensis]|uniref:NCS2 family permease n=1 Tax=Bacilliculturomica massiliensis TaxID=1917867 RepID=UPI00102FBC21|nr:NCS2 family permease [Bacilliculturomica massiliensis]
MNTNTSFFEKKFRLQENGTSVKIEMLAGTTIFFTCVYIVAVNPAILSAAGMDARAVFWATALSSALSCIWMGFYVNVPFALCPSMGLNAYFAYYMVNTLGLTWQNALGCVFISGISFVVLSLLNVQQKIVDAIPDCIKQSLGAGIGFFIAFTGLFQAGVIAPSPDTLLTLGDLRNPGALLTIFGILVTSFLVIRKIKGGILLGVLITTAVGIFVQNPATGSGFTAMPASLISFDNPVEALAPTFMQLSFKGMFTGAPTVVMGVVFSIISFLFVDLFNSIGGLLGVATRAGLVDENGDLPCAGRALLVSSAGAAAGAVLGTNTVTIYCAESSTGIAEGGRTGLTAVTCGFWFLLTLLFAPLFLMIPSVATAPALVMVGIFMIEPLRHLSLDDVTIAMPVFFTVAFMPFAYNISYGMLFGLLSYTFGQIVSGRAKNISPTLWILSAVFLIYFILDIII